MAAPGDFTLRPAGPRDADFLTDLLIAAVNWESGRAGRGRANLLAHTTVARYVAGWPRADDLGVVAVDRRGEPIGAAWLRHFSAEEPGYGFVSPDVPELSIGVVPSWRGRGVAVPKPVAAVTVPPGIATASATEAMTTTTAAAHATTRIRQGRTRTRSGRSLMAASLPVRGGKRGCR